MDIQDLCKKQRFEKRFTNQYIADESGVSINTVTNFFSSRSKCPSIYTVGPICAVLDISIDEYFGICPDFREVDNLKLQLKKKISQEKEREAILRDVLSTILPQLCRCE